MIDIRKLVEWDKKYIEWINKKWGDLSLVDRAVSTYKQVNELSQALDEKRSRQNVLAKQIPNLEADQKQAALNEMKEIKSFLKNNEWKEKDLKNEVKNILSSLPNPAHESVIPWESDEQNKVKEKWWEKPNFDFEPKPHWVLWKQLDLIDSERWAKVAWARFHFLKWELVLLQFALVQYAFQVVWKYGFKPVLPPYLVNQNSAYWTWFLDSWHEEEVYCVNPGQENYYLIWTSEVPNTAYYANEIIDEKDLPIRISAYSPCFRREAWSAWKDTKWIQICHQLDKVEMWVFCDPDKSWEEHDRILSIEEEIYQWLWIHYQLIDICAWDLGWSAAKKWDIEAWMPGQWKYREVTSTSNCTDFQARRLNIRIKRENWKNEILHTLNWTAIALWRTLIAIMENYQDKNWDILVPEVLKKWVSFDKISK